MMLCRRKVPTDGVPRDTALSLRREIDWEVGAGDQGLAVSWQTTLQPATRSQVLADSVHGNLQSGDRKLVTYGCVVWPDAVDARRNLSRIVESRQ